MDMLCAAEEPDGSGAANIKVPVLSNCVFASHPTDVAFVAYGVYGWLELTVSALSSPDSPLVGVPTVVSVGGIGPE